MCQNIWGVGESVQVSRFRVVRPLTRICTLTECLYYSIWIATRNSLFVVGPLLNSFVVIPTISVPLHFACESLLSGRKGPKMEDVGTPHTNQSISENGGPAVPLRPQPKRKRKSERKLDLACYLGSSTHTRVKHRNSPARAPALTNTSTRVPHHTCDHI